MGNFRQDIVYLDDLYSSEGALSQECLFFLQMGLCVKILKQSPLALSLLKRNQGKIVSITMDSLLSADDCLFYTEKNRIDLGYQSTHLIGTEKGISFHLLSLLRALFFLDCAKVEIPLKVSEENLQKSFIFTRLEKASAEVFITSVAWELRAAGVYYPWRTLISGSNGDIAISYEQEAEHGTVFDGVADSVALDAWFDCSERVDASDHELIEKMDADLLYKKMLFTNINTKNKRPCSFKTKYNKELSLINKTHLTQILSEFSQVKEVT